MRYKCRGCQNEYGKPAPCVLDADDSTDTPTTCPFSVGVAAKWKMLTDEERQRESKIRFYERMQKEDETWS